MILDYEDQVCRAQAFTATAVSANSKDFKTAASDFTIGAGCSKLAGLFVPTVAAGAGSTHVLAVVQADDSALTTNVEVLGSVSVAAASLTVGALIEIPITTAKTRRYIGIRDTISGGTTTVTADAWIVGADDIPKYKSFPKVVHADNN